MGWPFARKQTEHTDATPQYRGLVMRKHAATDDNGEKVYDGLSMLDTPNAIIPTTTIARGIDEGWVTAEGMDVEHVPGGPADKPELMWSTTHTFIKYTRFTFHTRDGDIHYKVVQNPGKYDGEVKWFYLADREA